MYGCAYITISACVEKHIKICVSVGASGCECACVSECMGEGI